MIILICFQASKISFGGGDYKEVARKALQKLATDLAYQEFNWAGTAPKHPFKDLALVKVVRCEYSISLNFFLSYNYRLSHTTKFTSAEAF